MVEVSGRGRRVGVVWKERGVLEVRWLVIV